MNRSASLRAGDALLIVDIQNDFLPGGALAVPRSDAIVPTLNRYIAAFVGARLPVYASRDWHPQDHCSFHDRGGPWPRHCVMHTVGAEFPAALALPASAIVLSKATDRAHEAYSDFTVTDLEATLHAAGVKRLFIGGLATEYCVLHTVRDALQRGFVVFLLSDVTRAVNLEPDDGAKAEAEMCRLGAVPIELEAILRWRPDANPLLSDLYQFTMLQGYFTAHMNETAVFEFFVRRLPNTWSFLVAAGIEQVLDFLQNIEFSEEDLDRLRELGFDAAMLERLQGLRFTGDVHAMPEGTIFFPDEPILRITAPMPEAQLVETRVVNLLHFQTLIASKAVRCVLAARGKELIDFGLRRAHGAEAGLLAARASFLAGFSGTSNVLAAVRFGIPVAGTMAHSFVEACASEEDAFLRFARANPRNVVLLIDTYDTEAAAAKVVRLAPTLTAEGIRIKGVRIDSGDLAEHARHVRAILDDGGLRDVTIFASGNLDEANLQAMTASGAPIDGFGVGTRVTTSGDAPYLDCAYKLQVYSGAPRCKRSEGKATWPGAKQVFREATASGMLGDTIALSSEEPEGEPLLECFMESGRRLRKPAPLSAVRERVAQQLGLLPLELRHPASPGTYPVRRSRGLVELARRLGMVADGATVPRTSAGAHPRVGFLRKIYADGEPPHEESEEEGIGAARS